MRKTSVLVVALLILMCFCTVAQARGMFYNPFKEPKNTYFDYALAATVAVELHFWQEREPSANTRAAITRMLIEELSRLQPKVIMMDEVIQQMSTDLNVDLFALKKSNPEKYDKTIESNLHKYADVRMNVRVGWCEMVNKHEQIGTDTYLTYGWLGDQRIVDRPVYSNYTTPFPDASLDIYLIPAKKQYTNWWNQRYSQDTRVDSNGRRRTPEDNMQEIMRRLFNEMPIPKKN